MAMDQHLKDLLGRLDEISGQVGELRVSIRQSVSIAGTDPEMSLTRARKALEYIVRDVYQRAFAEPPGTRPLENLLQRLVKEDLFPKRLAAYANSVRELGNVGTHGFGEGVTAQDVYQALTQLLPIVEWYLPQKLPPSVIQGAGEAKGGPAPAGDTASAVRSGSVDPAARAASGEDIPSAVVKMANASLTAKPAGRGWRRAVFLALVGVVVLLVAVGLWAVLRPSGDLTPTAALGDGSAPASSPKEEKATPQITSASVPPPKVAMTKPTPPPQPPPPPKEAKTDPKIGTDQAPSPIAGPLPIPMAETVYSGVTNDLLEKVIKSLNLEFTKKPLRSGTGTVYNFNRNNTRVALVNYGGKDLMLSSEFRKVTLQQANDFNCKRACVRTVVYKDGSGEYAALESNLDVEGGVTENILRNFITSYEDDVKEFALFLRK